MRRRMPPLVSSIMGLKTHPREPAWKTLLRVYVTTIGADRVIVMAPAIADVVRRLPIRTSRTVRMSAVGVDVPVPPSDARVSVREELGVAEHIRLVSTVGRLDPTKSHDLFIRAADEVLASRDDVAFLLVGGGTLEDELQAQVTSTGRSDRILLLGERDDVTRLLAATDVYVRPGVVEGFIGITVLEAQVLGIPAVAFETEDVKLAIEPGRTGLLVPPGDTTALAAAVNGLLDDPARRAAIAAAGREHAIARYSLVAVVDRLEALYEQLSCRSSAMDLG